MTTINSMIKFSSTAKVKPMRMEWRTTPNSKIAMLMN